MKNNNNALLVCTYAISMFFLVGSGLISACFLSPAASDASAGPYLSPASPLVLLPEANRPNRCCKNLSSLLPASSSAGASDSSGSTFCELQLVERGTTALLQHFLKHPLGAIGWVTSNAGGGCIKRRLKWEHSMERQSLPYPTNVASQRRLVPSQNRCTHAPKLKLILPTHVCICPHKKRVVRSVASTLSSPVYTVVE